MDARQIRGQIEIYAKQRENAIRQREEANRITLMLEGAIEALTALANQEEAEKSNDTPTNGA